MDPKITSAIWSNLEFDQATPTGKLAALWLITNEHVDVLGYADLSLRRFVFETQLSEQALAEGFQALGKGIERVAKGYWLRNYIGIQFGRGPALSRNNFARGITNRLNGGCDAALVRLVLGEYAELLEVKGFVSPLKALGKGSRGSSNHKSRAEQSREEQSRAAKGVQGETAANGAVDAPPDDEPLVEPPADDAATEADGQRPTDVDEVILAAQPLNLSADEAATFFDHYEANGWKQGGRTPLKSWRAALRNWARRSAKNSRGITPHAAPDTNTNYANPPIPGLDPFNIPGDISFHLAQRDLLAPQNSGIATGTTA